MTNGEKIKEIFPSIELYEKSHDAIQINFDSVWWNAEYKEPTTKNNLAHNLCDSCTNIRCEFQSGIVRTKCAFYMPPQHSSGLEKNSKKLEKDFGESDCISRAGVIKILGKIEHMVWEGEGFDYEESRAMIDELPSVTPIRPKGHWIGQKKIGFGEWKECIVPLKDGFVTDSCSCSECGDWLTGSDEYQCSGNFCPNCGADMREVEE